MRTSRAMLGKFTLKSKSQCKDIAFYTVRSNPGTDIGVK